MRCGVTPDMVTELRPNEVFVFGSNQSAVHGAGAAKSALAWGAVMGEGFGLHGQTYAIDTMSGLDEIPEQLDSLWRFAVAKPDKHLLITALGCGIAGHNPDDICTIWAMKKLAKLPNVSLPQSFINVLKGYDNE